MSGALRETVDESNRLIEPGSIISGKYRIERIIARGGMGRVFLATQLPLERQVALKLLIPQAKDRSFRRRFLLEASTCARLVHRNIVTVHDYGETEDGQVYMAMEYLDGHPLSRIIKQEGRLSPERACRIAMQTCRALHAAHQIGVVHRDLKPSNIMLMRDDEAEELVKVLDFGLVKVSERSPGYKHANLELTGAGTLLGSPKYMAPEQIRAGAIDARTDVYSLGVIMFHMLAGRAPFLGGTGVEILNKHLHEVPPRFAELIADDAALPAPAEALEAIVRRALEKDPTHRQQSMEELVLELKAALATPPPPLREPLPRPDTLRVFVSPPRKFPRVIFAIVAPLIAALTIVPLISASAPEAPPPAASAPIMIEPVVVAPPPVVVEEKVVEEKVVEEAPKLEPEPQKPNVRRRTNKLKRARTIAAQVRAPQPELREEAKPEPEAIEQQDQDPLPSLDAVDRDRAKDIWVVDQVPIVD